MNSDVLHKIALETLKSKINLAESNETEIIQAYYQIYTNLKQANDELPKSKINVLK